MKVIYESEHPVFAIGVDSRQWILAVERSVRKDGGIDWGDRLYFSKFSSLLDHLAEYELRRSSKRVKGLQELGEQIQRVYELIDEVGKRIEVALKKK